MNEAPAAHPPVVIPLPGVPKISLPGCWDRNDSLSIPQLNQLTPAMFRGDFETDWLPDPERRGYVRLRRHGEQLTGVAYYTADQHATVRECAGRVCTDPVMELRLTAEHWEDEVLRGLDPQVRERLSASYGECRGIPVSPQFGPHEFQILWDEHLRVAASRAREQQQEARAALVQHLKKLKRAARQVVLN